jgi:PKD repeat protein
MQYEKDLAKLLHLRNHLVRTCIGSRNITPATNSLITKIAWRPTGTIGAQSMGFSDAANSVDQNTVHKIAAAGLHVKIAARLVTVQVHVAVHPAQKTAVVVHHLAIVTMTVHEATTNPHLDFSVRQHVDTIALLICVTMITSIPLLSTHTS